MIQPCRAAVRPRVFAAGGVAPLLLEEEIQQLADRGAKGAVAIFGGPGAGKTTALQHLAAVVRGNVEYNDEAGLSWCLPSMAQRLEKLHTLGQDEAGLSWCLPSMGRALSVISLPYASAHEAKEKHLALLKYCHTHYTLARWTDDDQIEYLLTTHKDCCRSVMARLRQVNDGSFLEGSPLLWAMVLDHMAAIEAENTAKGALRTCLLELFSALEMLEVAGLYSLAMESNDERVWDLYTRIIAKQGIPNDAVRLLRLKPCQLLMAAEYVAASLKEGTTTSCMQLRLPPSLIVETAGRLRGNPGIEAFLATQVPSRLTSTSAMAASLWHQLDQQWLVKYQAALANDARSTDIMPVLWEVVRGVRDKAGQGEEPSLILPNGYFPKALWPGANLSHADLGYSNLSDADLTGATLTHAFLNGTNFRLACLRKANLHATSAASACFQGAQLCEASVTNASWKNADLSGADLSKAVFTNTNMAGVNLTEARLQEACLRKVELLDAIVTDADFTGVDFQAAVLNGIDFSKVRIGGNSWIEASLKKCNLERVQLPLANFRLAILKDALLTNSIMPSANFFGADLRNTGLAGIDWEGSDLRDVDLTGASFHMGSSRDGLVGSPIACEGSRTGFYTDDYGEQDFKRPEEIRKANLCGADLRGAIVEDTDFYLVDLRGAKYGTSQAEHFRRCGAILHERCLEQGM